MFLEYFSPLQSLNIKVYRFGHESCFMCVHMHVKDSFSLKVVSSKRWDGQQASKSSVC